MPLSRSAANPLYVQLRDALRADIHAGVYRLHQRLPSERELSEKYNLSRMTARQALVALERDGLIYRRHGAGTFVAEPKIDQRLEALTGFTQDVRARGREPGSRVLQTACLPATTEVADALRIAPGSEIKLLKRLRLSNGVPLAIEAAYLPSHLVPDLFVYDFAIVSLYEILAGHYGLHLARAEQRIEASLADPCETSLLELVPPAAVLRTQRLTLRDDGYPVEWVVSAYRSDRYAFRSTLAEPGTGGTP
jgi:GntR family transcriptional regulator